MKHEGEVNNKIRTSAGDRTVEIVCYIIFSIAAFLCLYPFYYIIIKLGFFCSYVAGKLVAACVYKMNRFVI